MKKWKNPIQEVLKERLAKKVHEHWWFWAETVLKAHPELNPSIVTRWQGYFKPYSELSEEAKEIDRKFAEDHLNIFVDFLKEVLKE